MQHLNHVAERIHAINVDVTDRVAMESAVAETVQVFDKVHVLVNNAGVVSTASASSTTYDDWDWLMGVNLHGVFNGVHAFLPRIKMHADGGQIITTSAIGGLVAGSGMGTYSASKFAVVGMMEALHAELAAMNIGASVFCPGMLSSNIVDSDRNRPSSLSDTQVPLDEKAKDTWRRRVEKLAMDPLEAGQIVLRGMRNNDLYIFSNPEFEPLIRARNEALIASIPMDLRPPAARVAQVRKGFGNYSYVSERDRKLCTRQ